MSSEDEIKAMLAKLHDAFFEVPPGSDGKPLINQIREVVTVYERLSWVGKVLLYIAALVGAVFALWGHIKAGILRAFGINA